MLWGPTCRLSLRLALGAIVGVASVHAHASEGDESILLEYQAPSECELRDDFVAQLMMRTSRARLAHDGESARRFVVHIVRAGRTFRGELVVAGANGEPFAREVSTDTCPQATRALALMLALSIDPRAHTGDLAQLGQPADAGSPSANERADTTADASPAPYEAPQASAERAPVLDTRTATAAFSFGLDAELLLLVPSQPVPAFGAYLELDWLQGSSVRASFRRSLPSEVTTDSVGGRLNWIWARIDACPLRWGLGQRFFLRPCAFGDLGGIDATGTGGINASRRARPWAMLGAFSRLGGQIGPVTGSVDLGLGIPLNQESFVFVPAPTVYAIPTLVPFAGLSVGGVLPL